MIIQMPDREQVTRLRKDYWDIFWNERFLSARHYSHARHREADEILLLCRSSKQP